MQNVGKRGTNPSQTSADSVLDKPAFEASSVLRPSLTRFEVAHLDEMRVALAMPVWFLLEEPRPK
jgi:hypothetical protein